MPGLLVLEAGRVRKARLQDIYESVYTIISLVPPGLVTTYGSIARLLGTSPRIVGRALRDNKSPILVPCHRVVRSDGSLGGYSGPGGVEMKRRLLELEGVKFEGDRVRPDHIVDAGRLLSPDNLISGSSDTPGVGGGQKHE